ncbi:MAG: DNA repair protein [Actinobacteria bacterium]|nr:DNA repair protein [Actinomycetota bacterium]
MTTPSARMADVPTDQRPRERLFRFGAAPLTDAELVAVLLGTGRVGRNVIDVAADVLQATGGAAGLLATPTAGLTALPGVGPVGACRIQAAAELARRAAKPAGAPRISTRSELAAVALPELRACDENAVLVIVLDRRLRLTTMLPVSANCDGHAVVPVAEILQRVVEASGAAFAVAHQHPGGTTRPTDRDRAVTAELRKAAADCGLRFLDHLIVAGDAWAAVRA